jgi:hypothetical protein
MRPKATNAMCSAKFLLSVSTLFFTCVFAMCFRILFLQGIVHWGVYGLAL